MDPVEHLRSLPTIRERCQIIFEVSLEAASPNKQGLVCLLSERWAWDLSRPAGGAT